MERLKAALEELDEAISALEDKVSLDNANRVETQKKQGEFLKLSRTREANVLAVAQKVASRLDHSIDHLENILRH